MTFRLKNCVFAALPLVGLFLTTSPVVLAKSHNPYCWEQRDSSRSDNEGDLYSDEASPDHSRAGQPSHEEDPYDGGRRYDDHSPYSLSDVLSSNANPPGLDTTALLPVLFGLLLSGH